MRSEDRSTVHDIVLDILMFEPIMPKLTVTIKNIDGDHYHCLFSGWTRRIPFLKFTETFLDKRTRDTKYDLVLPDAEVMPEQEGEGGPYVVVRIRARSQGQSDRRRR